MSNVKNPKGRKPYNINWPKTSFTVNELANQLSDISRVSIQLKINSAIESGVLIKVGEVKGKGRPSHQYQQKDIPVESPNN